MGIIGSLLAKKGETENLALLQRKHGITRSVPALTVHPDLKDLLWIIDGPLKNDVPGGPI